MVKEIILCDNGVVIFDEEKGFFGGRAKAKHIVSVIAEAKKRVLC